MVSIKISVQAEPRDLVSWLSLARRLEADGFDALLVGDHPGSGCAPWPALGAAAAVTTSLGLGTYVLQAGIRDPVQAAADAATLDVLAPGRVLLGLGAGHTYREWEVGGQARPSAADRAARLVEFVGAVAGLLRGETVSLAGRYVQLVAAHLDDLPAAGQVRLLVGGGHDQVLRAAAAHADIVALSGLGRTLPDGHRHLVRWNPTDLQARLRLIEEESHRRGTHPEIEALVQHVTVTERRNDVLAELSERTPGTSADDLSSTPFLLIGTIEQMASQLTRQSERLGITRYVVRERATGAAERLIARLNRE